MSSNYYELYVKDTFKLVKSLGIKSQRFAELVNSGVIADHGESSVDTNDQRSWKYYQNIAGRYHFTDTPMHIVSLDTRESIVFSKENLLMHHATKKAYVPGNVLYDDLINRYPNQLLLIMSIVFSPETDTFIDDAIAASDGQILYYDAQYIESNEATLMSEIQDWIYRHLHRWYVNSFDMTDEYYPIFVFANLHLLLIALIINCRLARCKTNEAHSFHIKQYLASHNGLDEFYDYMTKEQALFLYRNLNYIETNAGKNSVFQSLIENILTKRGLLAFEYVMRHDNSNSMDNPDTMNTPVYHRKALNYSEDSRSAKHYSHHTMLSKISDLAPYNQTYASFFENDMFDQVKFSQSGVLQTKMIEATITDYSKYAPYPLEEILFQHWVHWSLNGSYRSIVDIELPNTKKTIQLTTTDAFSLFVYCTAKISGVALNKSVRFGYTKVIRDVPTTKQEIVSKTNSKWISSKEIDHILAYRQIPGTLRSVESFYQKCHAIYTDAWAHHELIYRNQDGYCQTAFEIASGLLYQSGTDVLDLGTNFTEWLGSLNLDLSDYSNAELYDLANNIMLTSTGLKTHQGENIKQIQRAMIEIMRRLCSYSVLFMVDKTDSYLEYIRIPTPITLSIVEKEYDVSYVENTDIFVLDTNGTESGTEYVNISKFDEIRSVCMEKSVSKINDTVIGTISSLPVDLGHSYVKITDGQVLSSTTTDTFVPSQEQLMKTSKVVGSWLNS